MRLEYKGEGQQAIKQSLRLITMGDVSTSTVNTGPRRSKIHPYPTTEPKERPKTTKTTKAEPTSSMNQTDHRATKTDGRNRAYTVGVLKAREPLHEETRTVQREFKMHPYYEHTHLGEPCTLGALDHLLICGHKVMTDQPEPCADNCDHQKQSRYINTRGHDQSFVCVACIIEEIREEHAENVSSFITTLRSVARATKKPNRENWIKDKVNVMEMGWRYLRIDKLLSQVESGRFCHAFYIDEVYSDLFDAILPGGVNVSKDAGTGRMMKFPNGMTSKVDRRQQSMCSLRHLQGSQTMNVGIPPASKSVARFRSRLPVSRNSI